MTFQNTAVEPATVSTTRNNKVGWYEDHERQVNLINNLELSTLLIGSSIVAGLVVIRTSGKNISDFQKQ